MKKKGMSTRWPFWRTQRVRNARAGTREPQGDPSHKQTHDLTSDGDLLSSTKSRSKTFLFSLLSVSGDRGLSMTLADMA